MQNCLSVFQSIKYSQGKHPVWVIRKSLYTFDLSHITSISSEKQKKWIIARNWLFIQCSGAAAEPFQFCIWWYPLSLRTENVWYTVTIARSFYAYFLPLKSKTYGTSLVRKSSPFSSVFLLSSCSLPPLLFQLPTLSLLVETMCWIIQNQDSDLSYSHPQAFKDLERQYPVKKKCPGVPGWFSR